MDEKQNSEVEDLGPESQDLTCPHCGSFVTTHVIAKGTTESRIFTLFKCFCCCWICCKSPKCMDTFKERRHYCPDCNAHLGTYT